MYLIHNILSITNICVALQIYMVLAYVHVEYIRTMHIMSLDSDLGKL